MFASVITRRAPACRDRLAPNARQNASVARAAIAHDTLSRQITGDALARGTSTFTIALRARRLSMIATAGSASRADAHDTISRRTSADSRILIIADADARLRMRGLHDTRRYKGRRRHAFAARDAR